MEFIFLMISLYLFDGDFFSPPVMSCLVIFIGTISAIPSVNVWDINIQFNLILVYFSGFLAIIFSSYLAKKNYFSNNRNTRDFTHTLKIIHCKKNIEFIILILSVVLTTSYFFNAIHVGTLNGGVGLQAIAYMKNAYLSNSGIKMNPIIRQSFKIVMLFAYISCFIIANNCIALGENVLKNFPYLVSILCGCMITIFSGSRTEMGRIMSSLLFCISICLREKNGWKRSDNTKSFKKTIRKLAPLLVIAVVIAFISRVFIKTSNVESSNIDSLIMYLSYYIGSPLQVFNIKLDYFHGINELLFGTNNEIPNQVYLGDLDYGGNVAGIFGAIFEYNGLIKMLIYLLVVYFVSTCFYYKLYRTYSSPMRNKYVILYSFIYFCFTLSFYANCFPLITQFSNITIIILIFVFYRFIFFGNILF